ncbi:Kef-type K+ transport system membrane component KefB [Methanobacterium oryzae]
MDILSNPSYLGPIYIGLGLIITISSLFKIKNYYNKTLNSIIILLALAILLIGEYYLVPIQNTIVYVFLLIMSFSLFMTFYFELKPQNLITKKEKILSRTGICLFAISLFSIMGYIIHNFKFAFITGAFLLILLVIIRLIRRRRLKNNALEN